jgi:hypothetical protein
MRMARTQADLPRMQNQSRRQPAPELAPAPALAPEPAGPARKPARKPAQMMRQYDLIDRVKQYNPNTNEDLLNRAYVYAMRAHGVDARLGRSLLLAPPRGRGDPHRPQAR